MLIDSRTFGLNFKYWSPMSVGAWALLVFSAVRVRVLRRGAGAPASACGSACCDGGFGRLFTIVGALFGLFLAGYTGVLLSVSNQPIWSDTWALGGLFLASGLSVAAAALGLLVACWRRRRARRPSSPAPIATSSCSSSCCSSCSS